MKNQIIRKDHHVGIRRSKWPSTLPKSVLITAVRTRPKRSDSIPARAAPMKKATKVNDDIIVDMISCSQNKLRRSYPTWIFTIIFFREN